MRARIISGVLLAAYILATGGCRSAAPVAQAKAEPIVERMDEVLRQNTKDTLARLDGAKAALPPIEQDFGERSRWQ